MAAVMETLPGKHKVLGSILGIGKKKKWGNVEFTQFQGINSQQSCIKCS